MSKHVGCANRNVNPNKGGIPETWKREKKKREKVGLSSIYLTTHEATWGEVLM